jgi:hypothetical protein
MALKGKDQPDLGQFNIGTSKKVYETQQKKILWATGYSTLIES